MSIRYTSDQRYTYDYNRFEFDTRVVATVTSTNPVTRDDAKNYLRVDHTEDDTLIDNQISVATEMVESFINRDVLSKQRELYYPLAPGEFKLFRAPIDTSVTVIVEVDGDATTNFEQLGFDDPVIRLDGGTEEKVTVKYTTRALAGSSIEQAILCAVAQLYYGRDSKVDTAWKKYCAHLKNTFI